jgi:hypothetical protein
LFFYEENKIMRSISKKKKESVSVNFHHCNIPEMVNLQRGEGCFAHSSGGFGPLSIIGCAAYGSHGEAACHSRSLWQSKTACFMAGK